MSSHCSFGVLDKVIPFILVFQVCYFCLIPPVPNKRPNGAGRFVAVGEKSRTASCPPVSPLGGNSPVPAFTLLSRRLSPKVSPDALDVSTAGPPHPTQRGTQRPEMRDHLGTRGMLPARAGTPGVTSHPQLRPKQPNVALALSYLSPETPTPSALWRHPLLPRQHPSPSLPRGPLHHSLTPAQGSSPPRPPTRETVLEKGGTQHGSPSPSYSHRHQQSCQGCQS